MVKYLKILRVFFVLFLISALLFFLFIYLVTVPVRGGRTILFTVEKGESVKKTAHALECEKLVFNARSFELLARFFYYESRIKAGDYQLSSDMNCIQILRKLVRGDVVTHKITIPEGSTIADIAAVLEKNRVPVAGTFIERAGNNRNISVGGDVPASLEGFLYPDTYQLPYRADAEEVIRQMTGRFDEVVLPLYKKSAEAKKQGLRNVIILASLVEKEAMLDSERPVIAAVYLNRIKRGMPLQCDATIQYILGGAKPALSYEDLKLQSPYNTYLHQGLPPGPIGNPGVLSIKAALSPGKDQYLFYVVNEKKHDGSHVFSRTYEEHLNAIRTYQDME